MPFEMCGDVILTGDVPERGLRAGDVGTVVEQYVVPDVREEGFSVEFLRQPSSWFQTREILARGYHASAP